MLTDKTEAKMLVLFIISELPEEVSMQNLRSILLSSDEIMQMNLDEYLFELAQSNQIYITKADNTEYCGITAAGQETVNLFSERKQYLRSFINKAMRQYKKLVCGVEYKIDMEKSDDGTNVTFSVIISGKCYFTTTMFFTKAKEALEVYNRMDNSPEDFYNGFLTVATGEIDYLM